MRFAQSSTTGTSIATIGVLFRNALIAETGTISRTSAAGTLRGRPRRREPNACTAPVLVSPETTAYSTPTVARPGFARPDNASAGDTTSATIRTVNAPTRITSGARRVPIKSIIIAATTASVSQASTSKAGSPSGG